MKALSVSQPWATVICSGMKDVENRGWRTTSAPGRILIQATSTRVPSDYERSPSDYVSTIKNARLMGHIPEYRDIPYGSIIGYVDCPEIVQDADSFWAEPDSYHWLLADAYMFDKPIEGVKGARGYLFDYDIDESCLPPAHKVELIMPERRGTHIIMPASKEVMERIENGAEEIMYDLTATNEWLYFSDNGTPLKTETIEFVGDGRTLTRKVSRIDFGPYTSDEGKPIFYKGFDGVKVAWSFVAIVFKL